VVAAKAAVPRSTRLQGTTNEIGLPRTAENPPRSWTFSPCPAT